MQVTTYALIFYETFFSVSGGGGGITKKEFCLLGRFSSAKIKIISLGPSVFLFIYI